MTIERSLVRAIGGDVVQGLPLGFAINATDASTIAVTDSAFVDAEELGVAMSGAGTHATLDHVVVTRTDAARPAQFGHAILAAYGGAVDIGHSILDRAPGVGLFYAGGSGTVSGSLVRRNGIGAHVQEGSTLVEADAPPDSAPDAELVVSKDVRFEDNATKTGEGDLPLPKLVTSP